MPVASVVMSDGMPIFVTRSPEKKPKRSPVARESSTAGSGAIPPKISPATSAPERLAMCGKARSSSPTMRHIVNPSEITAKRAICLRIFIPFSPAKNPGTAKENPAHNTIRARIVP